MIYSCSSVYGDAHAVRPARPYRYESPMLQLVANSIADASRCFYIKQINIRDAVILIN
jgi:hypothetical protein